MPSCQAANAILKMLRGARHRLARAGPLVSGKVTLKSQGIPSANRCRREHERAASTIIANPVLHDKSNAIRDGAPTARSEDRTVRYLDGATTTQRQMTGTGMTNADTGQFITYDPIRSRPDNVTGTVDTRGYLHWLNANGYGLTNLTVQ